MDTRSKIIDPSDLPRHLNTGDWTAVVGLFDPLTASQAKRIAAQANSGRKVLAVILPGENTLLTPESRAFLVAALRDVDLVAVGRSANIHLPNVLIDDDEAAELKRSEDFVEFIGSRA